ncbi:long-chain-fatty-acid--CoA ligase [Vineibacter terrae]|uniref:3-methylmercaptopropionyl-CoA ligase n=1 Tax=Vineibacter terrae TaxID=2586908 RepID=A0A5C8PUG6_9HYPH|nr:long-chain-fatty-acid--CoA ligase [Vineibacter terrae]TXL81734.1 long-chain-fatty-acid--CoA ligase [Vineibacter terrae]
MTFELTSLLKRAVQLHGPDRAAIHGTRQRTWAETADRSARLAGALQALGMEPGAPVAILAHASDRYLEYLWGVLWGGGVLDPMNTRHARPEIAYCLNDSRARILLIDDAFATMAPALRADAPSLASLIWIGDGPAPDGMLDYEALVAQAAPAQDARRRNDDLAGIFYTGGTTGQAKGVMLSHTNLLTAVIVGYGTRMVAEGSSLLHTMPLFHLSGIVTLLSATGRGNCNLLPPRFEPGETLRLIGQHRPASLVLAPTMLQMLLDHPAFAQTDMSSVETVTYGASPMPETLLRRAIAVLPGTCGFVQAYGMTETSAAVTLLGREDHDPDAPTSHRLRSAGRVVPVSEIRIVGPDGEDLPRGQAGEIAARGPNVMLGYLNKPEETARALRDGWMHTGDGGYMDEDGYIYVVDRIKDMIVSGGENVYSVEVEAAISRFPAVALCAVVGIPHPKWGEAVHAIVQLKPGASATAEAIIAHCREQIAGYKCPRSIDIRTEPLPLTAAGKIQKNVLRAPFWEGYTRRVN